MDKINSDSIEDYNEQLKQIDQLLSVKTEESERNELMTLRNNITELILLINSTKPNLPSTHIDDEYALFQAAISEEFNGDNKSIEDKSKHLEGMKCRAPHTHSWGATSYYNAVVVCVTENNESYNDIKVRILFTNPTHFEMLPCKYYFDAGYCRNSDHNCKNSHGSIVKVSELLEYIEPRFDLITVGCNVLAKNLNTQLWNRAIVLQINEENCLVKFESNQQNFEVLIEHLLPLINEEDTEESDGGISDIESEQDIINLSLINKPSNTALGDWEKYTKGIGSKLMQKMGYIIGTGLGRCCDGRIEPVNAIILPQGKSLDFCMNLREKAGGDENYFNLDNNLLKQKRRQRRKFQQHSKNTLLKKSNNNSSGGVFNFLNKTLSSHSQINYNGEDANKRLEMFANIKDESKRNLNVTHFKIIEDIKRVNLDLFKMNESLQRHNNTNTQTHKLLKEKIRKKQMELKKLNEQSVMIKNEQRRRDDHKKMTVF